MCANELNGLVYETFQTKCQNNCVHGPGFRPKCVLLDPRSGGR